MRCQAKTLSDYAAVPLSYGYRSRAVRLPGEPLVLRFGGGEGQSPTVIPTGLPILHPEGVEETLTLSGAGPVQEAGPVLCQAAADFALLAIQVDETAHGGIEKATFYAYRQLLEAARQRQYPCLVRVWNYLADINGMEQDMERYRAFCVGRHGAFAEAGIADDDYPSACALGHAGGPLLIYMLVSRTPGRHFENPVQTRAYRYPQRYGPRSPSFARATLLSNAGEGARLFVSGTASVVGHETRHQGDIHGQLAVTFSNLDRLTDHVVTESSLCQALVPGILKVYLRHPEDLAAVQQAVEQRYGDVPVVYVQADVCRSDLLVEIDGVWEAAG